MDRKALLVWIKREATLSEVTLDRDKLGNSHSIGRLRANVLVRLFSTKIFKSADPTSTRRSY